MQHILQEKGQTLVIKLLHAAVFSLSSYMLSDVADVIIELVRNDSEVRYLGLVNFSTFFHLTYKFHFISSLYVPFSFS